MSSSDTYNPLVSILTLTYNHERYIKRCVESVIAQTYPKWEQIIIDDDSLDGTRTIVEDFKDPRISISRQKHRGAQGFVDSYNDALKRARGQLVAYLDGDDYWPDYRLERQVKAFEDPFLVLSYGPMIVVQENGLQHYGEGIPASLSVRNNDPPGSILPDLLFRNFIPGGSVTVRRSILDYIGGFLEIPGATSQDYATWLNLALLGRFGWIESPLFYYQQHRDSMSSQKTADKVSAISDYAIWFASEKLGNYALGKKLLKRKNISVSYARLREGRRYLIQGRWTDAKKLFSDCARSQSKMVSLLAIISMSGVLFHRDMESLFRYINRFLKKTDTLY
ncbi:MAG: glycosyltransferase [Nitrososphaerales archaeon]